MKKNILLLSFATLLCGAHYSFAKDANPVKIKCFEAEGVTTYDVRGCIPGSDISFYSTQGGGQMMKEVSVNASGNASVAWDQKASPAFVLNVLNLNASGIAGNGMVSFTGDKEFTVNDLAIDDHSGNNIVSWNASVSNTQGYAFEVLKSVNGTDYSLIQTVNAQSTATLPYSFTDLSQSNGTATYQIRVINTGKDVYYTSRPLYADGVNGISVYPTVAHSSLNVRLNEANNNEYKIMNMQGQVMTSGTLSNPQNTFSVASLPAGNYLIQISNGGKQTTTKFVKE